MIYHLWEIPVSQQLDTANLLAVLLVRDVVRRSDEIDRFGQGRQNLVEHADTAGCELCERILNANLKHLIVIFHEQQTHVALLSVASDHGILRKYLAMAIA